MKKFAPFHEWLAKQKNQRTPLGEWARSAGRDENFPKDLTTVDALVAYLRTKQATGTELATARAAWSSFAREQK
ncbi:MAG TPA: YozE family protein [Polyangiaceae bacterium]|jgi:uncharacterized protein YozE (UPF0346 family)|nr:YozE family protein [Polyangiaceae bacterium]